ncbi:hypothetical protein NDU88_004133 [Pleurodeles waltl]|uniref:Uncharacterized protein n=1 Tax=Pleurodeles waltl TaxID=8319 RepID=A0AAV7T898_PLEWA|nr:hypothetical protein NDU88_004133 [Pleurodeles waltl]
MPRSMCHDKEIRKEPPSTPRKEKTQKSQCSADMADATKGIGRIERMTPLRATPGKARRNERRIYLRYRKQ